MKNSADPSTVGRLLGIFRKENPDTPLSELADRIVWDTVSPYSPTESTVDVTIREYQQEKIEEARQGMASAIRYCVEHGIDYSTPEEGRIVPQHVGEMLTRTVGPKQGEITLSEAADLAEDYSRMDAYLDRVSDDPDPADCTSYRSGIDRNGDVTHPTE